MRSASSALALLLASMFLLSCGGSDSPTGPDAPTIKEDPSFASDIVPIFGSNGCTAGGCHGSPSQAGLTLATSPYTALVDVPSSQTGEIRVIPGNANDSYLVKKLEGRATSGVRMPVGGQMGSTDLTNIKNWINQGAKNN